MAKTTKRNRKRSGQAGVTLIEMLVVVTIIGLFVALVGPALFKRADEAKVTVTRAQIDNFMTALGTYKLDTGTFPTTEQGLQALRVKPADVNQWNGPYMPKDIPKDAWSRDFSLPLSGRTSARRTGDHEPRRRWPTRRRRDQCRHRQLEKQIGKIP